MSEQDDPWWNRQEKVHGFVIRAETEQEARAIAHQNAGDENRTSALTDTPWLDPKYTTCKILLPDVGMEGVIIQDYLSS